MPTSVHASVAGARGRRGGGGVGGLFLELGSPPGAKRAVGAGVRPLQMADAADPGTRELRHCHPPRGGGGGGRFTQSCVSLVTGKEPSPPKTSPGTGFVPVTFSPSSPGTWRTGRAPGSWMRAASPRRRWPDNSGRGPKKCGFRLDQAWECWSRPAGTVSPRGKLRHRGIYRQSPSGSAPVTGRGRLFPCKKKQRRFGKSSAAAAAAAVTATSRIWGWRFLG